MTPHTTDVMLEFARLRPALGSLRMRYANLLAAARATLTAARDGDANPLAYLIDELAAQDQISSHLPRRAHRSSMPTNSPRGTR